MLKKMADKCLGCLKPSCEIACPLHNRIRDFILEVKKGDIIKAREILDETSPFPYICSNICDYNRQCFGNCIRNKMNDPVYVYEIEKEIAKIDIDYKIKPSNNQKIAIIGSGVGGLSIAKLLRIDGFDVDIYEKENFIGGTVKSGIPSFRLDPKLLEKMINEVRDLGVNFILNQTYPNDFDIKSLKVKGYHKIIFACGAMKSNKARVINGEYAIDGLKFLYDLNINHHHNNYKKYNKAFIVGGGNVAMDCAFSLKRIIDDVTIIYRRSISEMPANKDEIEDAIKLGIKIVELKNPKELVIENDKLIGFKAEVLKLGEKDQSGRASFSVIEGLEEYYEADILINAIGQKVDISDNELTLTPWGTIDIDDEFKTNINDVYAIGDVTSGPSNVARVMYDAKRLSLLLKGEN